MAREQKKSAAERLESGELTGAEVYELTREAAVSSLDRAMQCRHGLEVKLLQRGYPASAIASVMNRLTEVGLLDDGAFADALVRARLDRGLAKRAIGLELARKGIEPGTAERVLDQIDATQQLEAAEAVANKAVNRCAGLATEVKARRAFGAVSRRGFSGQVAAAAVAKALAAEADVSEIYV